MPDDTRSAILAHMRLRSRLERLLEDMDDDQIQRMIAAAVRELDDQPPPKNEPPA